MKDEIKEIIQLIGNCSYHGEISEDECKKYCNYITNLQEENERLNNEIKTLLKENSNKEKVIIKQNNITNEIFEWMQNKYDNSDFTGFTVSFQELQDLKELKGKN